MSDRAVRLHGVYFKNKRVFVLSYVDDLLLAGASTEDLYEMVEMLRKELKLKVTADLSKDGKIHFLGREILRSEPGGDLKFGMDPGYMQDVLEGYKLETQRGCLRHPASGIFWTSLWTRPL